MGTNANLDALIGEVQEVVARGIGYVEANADSEVKIDIWTPREVLCHWIFWHSAAVEGIEGVIGGGGPYRVYASVDEMNARSVGRKSGWTVDRLVEEMVDFQKRLLAGVRGMEDADAVVMVMPDGEEMSAVGCMRGMVEDWSGHLDEMAAAAEAAAAVV